MFCKHVTVWMPLLPRGWRMWQWNFIESNIKYLISQEGIYINVLVKEHLNLRVRGKRWDWNWSNTHLFYIKTQYTVWLYRELLFFPSQWKNPAQMTKLKDRRLEEMKVVKEKKKEGSALLWCFLRSAWRTSRGNSSFSRNNWRDCRWGDEFEDVWMMIQRTTCLNVPNIDWDDDDEAVLSSYYEGMREIKRVGEKTSILIQSLRVVCFLECWGLPL